LAEIGKVLIARQLTAPMQDKHAQPPVFPGSTAKNYTDRPKFFFSWLFCGNKTMLSAACAR